MQFSVGQFFLSYAFDFQSSKNEKKTGKARSALSFLTFSWLTGLWVSNYENHRRSETDINSYVNGRSSSLTAFFHMQTLNDP